MFLLWIFRNFAPKMSLEIERKFLVADVVAAIAAAESAVHIVQGYLSVNPDATVRVRICDDRAYLTVKSRNRGAVRGEWEYEVPPADARELMALSVTVPIDKTRYKVEFAGHVWEVDIFIGPRRMALAEVELTSPDEPLELPPWLGREVTGDSAYYNSTIALGGA